jgi:hypothetical protein
VGILCKVNHIISGYLTMSRVQIGVNRLNGERLSQGKERGMGNFTTFLKTLNVVTDWCNSSTNILISSLFNACTQSLY